jgi:hypothetical protein
LISATISLLAGQLADYAITPLFSPSSILYFTFRLFQPAIDIISARSAAAPPVCSIISLIIFLITLSLLPLIFSLFRFSRHFLRRHFSFRHASLLHFITPFSHYAIDITDFIIAAFDNT